ncbi:hypothetical protein MLD38_039407 [Melastoma candidum]|uniref:Uncharacterized protein n=1 Tax=Melastoma candidum TaxID=119954 RepID=A0ACB9L369_9MYRT|nr:hypothetical protein MLD38_039407 [Melastoma candidum]
MSSPLVILASLILPLVVIIFLLIQTNSKRSDKNLPPGPRRLPILGNLHQLGPLPHRSLTELSRKYGPLVYLRLGSIPVLVISTAEAAREALKTHDRAFSGRPNLFVAGVLTYGFSDVSFGAYGDTWRALRKIMVTELLGPKRVQSFELVRAEEIRRMLDTVSSFAARLSPVNITELAVLLANDVVCRVTFGKRCSQGEGKSKFHETICQIQAALGGFCVRDLFPGMRWFNKVNGFEAKVEKYFRDLDGLYEEIIAEHKGAAGGRGDEDLVDVLLRLQGDPDQEITLTNEQIKGVMTDTFNAGTDTSASSIVWTMTELMRHPAIMKKAQDEVRSVARGRSVFPESDLPNLNYLKSVVKESLRLHPPLPLLVPKTTIENCRIMGYDIPKGTTVFINETAISTDPRSWESPGDFKPERFLKEGSPDIDFKGQDYEFLPFGAGRRGCPGINFGVVVIELSLANLLNGFDWELPPGTNIEDVDLEEEYGLTTCKKNPLRLVPIPVLK